MTVQDVDNAFRRKAESNPTLFAIRKKIEAGTATMEDAAKYNEIVSNILGKTVGENITKIPESERVKFLDWLLRNQYNDTNERLSVIQKFLDEKQGLHLAPQKAPYPAERVQQLGRSLTDRTVTEKVIERRARAGTANISKSFHDGYIKENAKFRSRAGLKCFITRNSSSGCCEWCEEVSGKYEFGDEPEDIFRRHDNCDCTVIYDNQVLRGKYADDGEHRTKTWEEIGELPTGFEPTAFSREQAEEMQNRNLPFILTESGKSGKWQTRTGENTVNLDMLHTSEYKQKFKGITGNSAVDQQLYSQAVAQLTHRNGTYMEDMVLIDSITGKIAGRQSDSKSETGVDYNSSLNRAIASHAPYSLISLHNHPTNNPPTGSDLVSNGSHKYALGVVVTHDCRVFTYKAGNVPFTASFFDRTVDKKRENGYNEVEAIIETLREFHENYGIEWSER